MSRLTRQVTCSERTVEVRELTVGEVRQWLADLDAAAEAEVDVVGEFMADGISFAELERFTDLAPAELDTLTESDVVKVVEAVKKLNPGFFRLRGRLMPSAQSRPAAT